MRKHELFYFDTSFTKIHDLHYNVDNVRSAELKSNPSVTRECGQTKRYQYLLMRGCNMNYDVMSANLIFYAPNGFC